MDIRKKLVDLVYPPRCPVCDDILQPGRTLVCDICLKKVSFVTAPTCPKCGKPVEEQGELCFDCQNLEHVFDQGIGILLYDDVMRKSMHRFKDQGRIEYAGFYARCVWKAARIKLEKWNPQVIVPVPIHKMRRRERGYNQSEAIARELSKLSGLPVENGYVLRKHRTKAQKDLSPEERRLNLEHAFAPGPKKIDRERILLLDDIYTTGSTMDGVGKILRQGGAREIYALSICIGKGFMVQ